MKTLFSLLAFTALVLTSSFTVETQKEINAHMVNGSFSFFRVHRQGKDGVALNWAVSNPNVARFIVERSYDGEFYDVVETKNANGASMYRTLDKEIYPGILYYRVTAVYANGATDASPVEVLRIVQRK
jgi:hypothetical protein